MTMLHMLAEKLHCMLKLAGWMLDGCRSTKDSGCQLGNLNFVKTGINITHPSLNRTVLNKDMVEKIFSVISICATNYLLAFITVDRYHSNSILSSIQKDSKLPGCGIICRSKI